MDNILILMIISNISDLSEFSRDCSEQGSAAHLSDNSLRPTAASGTVEAPNDRPQKAFR
jgi:hypothetical protein